MDSTVGRKLKKKTSRHKGYTADPTVGSIA